MTNDRLKKEIDGILQTYLDLGNNAVILVRELKKTSSAKVRSKLIDELRDTDKKQIELLNQSVELFNNPRKEILLR